ncbi:MAG: CorA family divalent cation transporter [Rubrimonas sp.]|uniref:CorA family divalent cation transporter n=1 Tax=Rubrimonas sp. TaxID=2036015 RepID=UPI002FDD1EBF
MSAPTGVIHAREIEPLGAARAVPLSAFAEACEGWRWVHLGRESLEARDWLLHGAGLPEAVAPALIAQDTRPRLAAIDGGVLLILRGANREPGERPEDMVSLRLFIEPRRVVSVEGRRVRAVETICAALDRGETPSPGAFVARLVGELREELEPVLDELQLAVDAFEIESLRSESALPVRRRRALNDARHDAIQLHRHVAPQAMAVARLARLRPDWLAKREREALRREADAFGRIAEDLEAVRSRSAVISDEAALRVAEQTNTVLLTLSAVSVVFLPLTFITGLFGVNLEGIPFAEQSWSFPVYSALVLSLGLGVALLLRWLRYL